MKILILAVVALVLALTGTSVEAQSKYIRIKALISFDF